MVKPRALPVDIYIRVSRLGGRENRITEQGQERRARELARERGLRIAVRFCRLTWTSPAASWTDQGCKRPPSCRGRRIRGGVIVAWLDRLSRDSEHAHGLVRRIAEAGGAIYAPDAPADWTTPEGELQAGIIFAFAQYVRSRARGGVRASKGASDRTRHPRSHSARGWLPHARGPPPRARPCSSADRA